MSEHQTRKRWIKLWTQETLHGTTLNELEPPERAVWFELLCLAGDSVEPGTICLARDIAYTDEQLAGILKVDLTLLKTSLDKLQNPCNKINRNGNGIIEICNWHKYQGWNRDNYMTEYMRDYRQGKRRKTNSKTKSKETNCK